MSKTHARYAPEFRRQMVDLVHAGRDPDDLARAFEPTAQSIRNWVAVAGVKQVGREEKGSAPVALRAGGRRHGRKRIARLMREARPAPDLVDRDFSANGPNPLWVADIMFVPTAAGFLYLAVVLGAWSRKVVGWSMANHLRTELVLDALDAAMARRRFASQAEARVAVFSFVEGCYNPVRLHSALGYRSPIDDERQMQEASINA